MTQTRRIIVSSINDCREVNGIVTFLQILRSNAASFRECGFALDFVNYVDLPADPASNTSAKAQASTSATVTWSERAIRPKRAIKVPLARSPLGSFLLMMTTLPIRGLVTAWRSRRLEQAGCIHFYQDAFCAFFGRFLHRSDACKVIILHSGDDALHQLFGHFYGMRGTRYEALVREHFRRTLRTMDVIVTLNHHYASVLRAEFPSVEVRCIYNTSLFSCSQASTRDTVGKRSMLEIVAVGSLQHRKGFELLIDALGGMPEAVRKRLHVTIVGGGAEHVALQAAIDRQGLCDVITLNGVSHNVAPFLARADAYILTSRDEGFPIALIEACSYGLPIISTRVGSIPEVFDESSCLFTDLTASSIRDALLAIAEGVTDLQQLAQRSQAIFEEKLSMQSFVGSYAHLCSSLGVRHED